MTPGERFRRPAQCGVEVSLEEVVGVDLSWPDDDVASRVAPVAITTAGISAAGSASGHVAEHRAAGPDRPVGDVWHRRCDEWGACRRRPDDVFACSWRTSAPNVTESVVANRDARRHRGCCRCRPRVRAPHAEPHQRDRALPAGEGASASSPCWASNARPRRGCRVGGRSTVELSRHGFLCGLADGPTRRSSWSILPARCASGRNGGASIRSHGVRGRCWLRSRPGPAGCG